MAGLKGKLNANAKFGPEEGHAIRRLSREVKRYGQRVWSASAIARKYTEMGHAVSAECIRRILRGETWAHLPDQGEAEEALEKPISMAEKMAAEASLKKFLAMQEEQGNNKMLD